LPFFINDSYDSEFWAWTKLALNASETPNNRENMSFLFIFLTLIF